MPRHPTRAIVTLLAAAPLLLSSCSHEPSRAAADGSPTTPAATPTDGSTAGGWTLLGEEPDGVPLDPGSYGLTANGVSHHVAVVNAPEGFQALGGWTFVTGAPFHAMGFVRADLVYPDPCGRVGEDKLGTARDPGPAVRDLADALVDQKGAVTSKPVPVTVDGHRGLFLTYRVARGIDVPACESAAFDIFSTGPGAWYLEASGERAAIWIVDVDGERLVLAWVAVPGVTRAQLREMTRMARSARFVEQGVEEEKGPRHGQGSPNSRTPFSQQTARSQSSPRPSRSSASSWWAYG